MSKRFSTLILALFALMAAPGGVSAEAERSSLGLQGCQVDSITGNSDGSLVIAACAFSANGIFYSTNFGGSWINAGGGDYVGGEVRSVELFGDKAYAAMDHQFFRSSFTSRASEGFKPAWTKVEAAAPGLTKIFKGGDDYLFVPNGGRLDSYNVQTDSFDGRSLSVPGGAPGTIVYGNSWIYVLMEQAVSGTVTKNGKALYRAAYDPTTASLQGGASWENLTGNFSGVDISDSDIWALFYDSTSNTLAAVIREFQGGGGSWTNHLFFSTDNGATFSKRVDLAFSANHACFVGSTWAFDERISTDGGNTFNVPQLPVNTVTTVRTEPGGCYIVPDDSKKIMVATNSGVAFTNDVTAGGVWQTSSSGFEALNVLKILQPESNKDKVVLATSSGLAYSSNFTSTTPSWIFPICPGGDCVGGGSVALDPVNSSNLYTGSGSIQHGTVSDDGQSITFSPFGAKPLDAFRFGAIEVFPFDGLKDRLFTAYNRYEGGVSGGIYTYDLSFAGPGLQNGTPVTDDDVAGHPIEALTAISSTVMFAARGGPFVQSEIALLVSRDGGTSWASMDRGALPAVANPSSFAYDSTKDILFGGISSQATPPGYTGADLSGVYLLSPASSPSASWVKSPAQFKGADGQDGPFNLSDIAVDTATGTVFVAAGSRIWYSEDSGQTFSLMYQGTAKEETEDLNVDADPVDASSRISIRTRRARLTQGINAGAYAFDLNQLAPVPTPTPTVPPASCKLAVAAACKKASGVSRNSTCVFTATVKNGRRAYKNANVRLERALSKSGPFTAYGKGRKADKKGISKFNAKIAKTSWYRVKGTSVSCTSNVIGIKVKGRR